MTIDEAIEDLRYDAQCNRADLDIEWAERNEQLAEWLELLKWYQQGMEDIPSESGVLPKDVYRAGYIKAIDDFAEQYKKSNVVPQVYERIFRMVQFGEDDFSPITSYIDKLYCDLADDVAEQLKAGDVDG